MDMCPSGSRDMPGLAVADILPISLDSSYASHSFKVMSSFHPCHSCISFFANLTAHPA